MKAFRRNIRGLAAQLVPDALERRALARFVTALRGGDPEWSRRRLLGELAAQIGRSLAGSPFCRLVARAARGDEAAQIELLAWVLGLPTLLVAPALVWRVVNRILEG